MSWLNFLKRPKKRRPVGSKTPIRTVQPPGTARRERLAREQAAEKANAKTPEQLERERRERELFDTGSLEIAADIGKSDNPYDTQSWQLKSSAGPRRVDDLKAINKKRKSGSEDNPYDTIVTRKGW